MGNFIKTLIISALFVFITNSVQSGEDLQRNILDLTSNQSIINNELDQLKDKLEKILERISEAKSQQENNYSIFREFGLRNLLKKAQGLTEKISSLAIQRREIGKTIEQKRTILYIQYSRRIDALLAQIKKSPDEKSSLLIKLKKVMIARASIANELSSAYRSGTASIYIDSSDSPGDILEKAQILRDYESRLKNELDEIEDRLKTLKSQKYALNEISHLIDEEDFFTETGFLKSVKKKEDDLKISKDTEIAAKSSINDTESTAQQEGTAPEAAESQQNTGEVPAGTTQEAAQMETSDPGAVPQGAENPSLESMTSESALASEVNAISPTLAKPLESPDSETLPSNTEVTADASFEGDKSDTKNTRLQNDLDHLKEESSATRGKPSGLNDEITTLEKKRTTFLELINEVGNKYKSLIEEASHLRMLKMK